MSTTDQPGTSPPEAPAVAPPSPETAAHQAASTDLMQTAAASERASLSAEVQNPANAEIVRFTSRVRENGFDFAGSHNGQDDFEQNDAFGAARNGLLEFWQQTTGNIPSKFLIPWMRACADSMLVKIKKYDGSHWGEMGIPEAEKATEETKNEIGAFEAWVSGSNLKEDYDKWKAEQGQKQQTAEQAQTLQGKMDTIKATPAYQRVSTCPRIIKNLEVVQGKITAADESAETEIENFQTIVTQTQNAFERIIALEARIQPADKIAPVALLTTINDLRTKIGEDNEEDLKTIGAAPALEEQTKAVEALKPFIEDQEIPDGKKEEIFAKVRDGTKTPAQAKEELEKARTTTAAAADEEDTPLIDKAKAFIDGMEEGTLKKTLGGLLAALTTTIIALAKLPWIGDKLRGTAISNEILAAKGDAKAVLALKVEGKFKKFGLPKRFANDLGGGKTSDVIKAIKEKPEELSTDKAIQTKLAWFVKQLESKGGESSDKSLLEFMAEREFAYSESQTAVASATPAAATAAANPTVASANPTQAAPANPPAQPNSPPPAPPPSAPGG